MKEVPFIDGKTKIEIRDTQLAAYLENLESAGYVVKANKCKTKEGFIDILMIGRAGDFEKFFSGNVRIKEFYKQSPRIYRILFNGSELILYLVANKEKPHE
jgi:hypothetical protein